MIILEFVVNNLLALSRLLGETILTCGIDGFYPAKPFLCETAPSSCSDVGTCNNHGKCLPNFIRNFQNLTYLEMKWKNDIDICNCDDGYHGWNCKLRNYCSRFGFLLNGYIEEKYVSYPGDNALWSCKKRYTLIGSSISTCLLNGLWSNEQPFCEPINDCGIPPSIINENVYYYSTELNSTALYACSNGFSILGSPVIRCLDNGWETLPSCIISICPNILVGLNVEVMNVGRAFGYRCPENFLLEGSEYRFCTTNGITGSSLVTICKIFVCGWPFIIDNSYLISISGHDIGDTAAFECYPGFEAIGSPIKTCTKDSFWMGDFICAVKTCSSLQSNFFRVSENLSFYPIGYVLTVSPVHEDIVWKNFPSKGEVNLTCDFQGFWYPNPPVPADPLECPLLEFQYPMIGQLFYVFKMYKLGCLKGFILNGTEYLHCVEKKWVPSSTEISCIEDDTLLQCPIGKKKMCPIIYEEYRCLCEDIFCTLPPYPINGGYNGTQKYLEKIFYFCNAGFFLVGPLERTCTQNGTFDKYSPLCEKNPTCSESDLPIENGNFIIIKYVHETISEFKCNVGFILMSVKTRKCMKNGLWSSPTPFCFNMTRILTDIPSRIGPTGDPGITGSVGRLGNIGKKGVQGPPGFPGVKGLPGLIGEPGPQGSDGDLGEKGAKGLPGKGLERGLKGRMGDSGPLGMTGLKGLPGLPGYKGLKGNKGIKGLPFIPLSDTCPQYAVRINSDVDKNVSMCVCLPGYTGDDCLHFTQLQGNFSAQNNVCFKVDKTLMIDCLTSITNIPHKFMASFTWYYIDKSGIKSEIYSFGRFNILLDGKSLEVLLTTQDDDQATLECVINTPESKITSIHSLYSASPVITQCDRTCGIGYRYLAMEFNSLPQQYCSVNYDKAIECGNNDACNRCYSCYNNDCHLSTIETCLTKDRTCLTVTLNKTVVFGGCDFLNLCSFDPSSSQIKIENLKIKCCRGSLCNKLIF